LSEDTLLRYKVGGGGGVAVSPTALAIADVMARRQPEQCRGWQASINFMLSMGRNPDSCAAPGSGIATKSALTPLSKLKVVKYDDDCRCQPDAHSGKWNDCCSQKIACRAIPGCHVHVQLKNIKKTYGSHVA
jgi:hypothetical protein